MKIKDLFNLYQGNGFELINMTINKDSNINFVSRTSENNGVVASVDYHNKKPFKSGLITVALGGSVLSSFVQLKDFYTGFHIMILEPKVEMSLEQKLCYCMIIKSNAYRYSYGRQANKTLAEIDIPDIDECNKIIHNCKIKIIKTDNAFHELKFDTTKWKEFCVKDLFDVRGTKTTKKDDLENYGEGIYPYVTTQAVNNGVEKKYNYYTENGNVLTIDSAVLGFCTYQENNFSASDHIEKLIPKFHMSKYSAMFLVTIFNNECYKYSYGRKANQKQIKKTKLKLPIKNNQPDWQFMENFIKLLQYADRI